MFPALALTNLAALALFNSAVEAQLPRGSVVDATQFASQKFDYIVVGGGTAGLVVAARLTENSNITVGVLEAGVFHEQDDLIDVPAYYGRAIGNPDYDWDLVSTPQAALNGRVVPQPRGKMLGGSSALNALVWQRGSRSDFDAWAKDLQNGDGWSWDGLLPYFKKSENWTSPPDVLPNQNNTPTLAASHGTGGPIQLSYNNYFPTSVIKSGYAANALGIPTNNDPDSGSSRDLVVADRVVDPTTGKRSYAATAYFAPNRDRPNLTVLTGAVVSKLLFSNSSSAKAPRVALGVQYIVNGTTYSVSAKKEVILAAGKSFLSLDWPSIDVLGRCIGSLKTPQILELSGVGNKTLLEGLGIKSVVDLPYIGENLQDHTLSAVDYIASPGVVTNDQLKYNATFLQEQEELYNTSHTGALTFTSAVFFEIPLQAYIPTSDFPTVSSSFNLSTLAKTPLQEVQFKLLKEHLDSAGPWAQFGVIPFGGLASTPVNGTYYLSAISLNYHPISRGYVHINSSSPLAPPVIDPNYFAHPLDVAVHSYGTSFTRKLFETAPLSADVASPNSPPASVQARADLDEYVKEKTGSTFHPLGTTPMAPLKLGGVVDPTLKIYGIKNVRIVDAGILPTTIGAALQPLVYAIAEKAADLIKASQ